MATLAESYVGNEVCTVFQESHYSIPGAILIGKKIEIYVSILIWTPVN